MEAMRFFNTEGPVRARDHYCIPPLERIDLDHVLDLVRSKKYFVLHAPRQTGKTSALLALRDLLNSGAAGDYRCVYANVEVGQAAREDTARAMRAMLGQLASRAETTLGDPTPGRLRHAALTDAGPDGALFEVLSRWAQADPRPLVLLIDEIDALIGDTLLSVLRQLRAGYDQRPRHFPHSVVLCGVRDVRDYRVHSTSQNALVLGGSALNIRSKSLRLGDFTEAEARPAAMRRSPSGACDRTAATGSPRYSRQRRPVRRTRREIGIHDVALRVRSGRSVGRASGAPQDVRSRFAGCSGTSLPAPARDVRSCRRRCHRDRRRLSATAYSRPLLRSRASTSSMMEGTVFSLGPLSRPS